VIIIKIFGGLGNQLFQYAFGKALAHKYEDELVIDNSYFKKENYPYDLHPDYYPYKLDLLGANEFIIDEKDLQWIKIINMKCSILAITAVRI